MFEAASSPDLIDGPEPLQDGRGLPSDNDLQRAQGSARMVVSGSEKGTRIVDVFERSPIRILFPRDVRGAIEEAVLVDTAGGIAGGDLLGIPVTACAPASLPRTPHTAHNHS